MKKITIAASLLGMAVAFSACDNYDERYPETYANVIKLNMTGETDVNVYSTEPTQELPFLINKGGWAPERDANVQLSVMSQDEFDEYAASMGFGYLVRIPDNCYYFGSEGSSSMPVNISGGTTYVTANLTVKPNEIEAYLEQQVGQPTSIKHCIPVKLSSSNEAVRVNEDYMYALLVPKYTKPTMGLTTVKGVVATTLSASEKTGKQTVTIPVQIPVNNRWDIIYTMDASQAALDELNTKNNSAYVMMPADAVSGDITVGEVKDFDFAKNAMVSDITITIDRDNLPYSQCALPLVLKDFRGNDDGLLGELSLNANTWALLTYSVSLIESYSTNDQEPSEGPLGGLFDGNPGTFFHSTWSGTKNHDPEYGVYVDIVFAQPMQDFGIGITARAHANPASPDHVKLFGSKDGENWTLIEELTGMGESLATSGATADFGPFHAAEPFTQLRFAVLSSRSGDCTNGGSYWNAAELSVYPTAAAE